MAVIHVIAAVAALQQARSAHGQRHRAAVCLYGVRPGFDGQRTRRYGDRFVSIRAEDNQAVPSGVDGQGPRRDRDLIAGLDRNVLRRDLQRRDTRQRNRPKRFHAAFFGAGQIQGQVRTGHRAQGINTVIFAVHRQRAAAAQGDIEDRLDPVAVIRFRAAVGAGQRARVSQGQRDRVADSHYGVLPGPNRHIIHAQGDRRSIRGTVGPQPAHVGFDVQVRRCDLDLFIGLDRVERRGHHQIRAVLHRNAIEGVNAVSRGADQIQVHERRAEGGSGINTVVLAVHLQRLAAERDVPAGFDAIAVGPAVDAKGILQIASIRVEPDVAAGSDDAVLPGCHRKLTHMNPEDFGVGAAPYPQTVIPGGDVRDTALDVDLFPRRQRVQRSIHLQGRKTLQGDHVRRVKAVGLGAGQIQRYNVRGDRAPGRDTVGPAGHLHRDAAAAAAVQRDVSRCIDPSCSR